MFQSLIRQYELMEMKSDENVVIYFNWVTTLTNQAKNYGYSMIKYEW